MKINGEEVSLVIKDKRVEQSESHMLLTSVSVPEGVEVIGNSAFFNSDIKRVILPKSLKTIGHYAFYGCKELEEIVIPEGVESIGVQAFDGCSKLKRIVIPASVTNFQDYVFRDCSNLEEVIFENDLDKIENGTFYNCEKLSKVKLPDSVTLIGDRAFYRCSELKDINLPSELRTIGSYCFAYCYNIKKVVIPENVNTIGDNAFECCKELEMVILPNSLYALGISCFQDCSKLKEIVIPEDISGIEYNAFFGCSSLEKITLPRNLKKIGLHSFDSCFGLKRVEIPEGTTHISDFAFNNCSNVEEFVLPSTLQSIGSSAFSGCSKIRKIVINEGIITLNNLLFNKCKSLEEVILPESLLRISISAFSKCSSLKKLVIPNNVTEIGSKAFNECTSLEEIVLPNNLQIIWPHCFNNCSNLIKVTLPASLKVTGYGMFDGCKNLKIVEMSSGTEIAGANLFNQGYKVFIDNKECNFKEYEKIYLSTKNEERDNVYNSGYSSLPRIFTKVDKSYITNCKIKYPNDFLKMLEDKELENIFKHGSIRHFKEIFNEYEEVLKNSRNSDVVAFYKFAYVLGCFSDKEDDIGGKKVNVGQKASVYLKALLDKGYLQVAMCSQLFDPLIIKKYDPEFIKYITDSFNNFEYLKEKGSGFSHVMNNFNKIMHEQIVANEDGLIMRRASVKSKIENFLVINSFENVSKRDEDIAREFSKFSVLRQKHYDEAVKIRDMAIELNVPSHILGKELKEAIINERIKELQEEIEVNGIECKKILNELYDKEFTYEWLDKHDARNFTKGLYCNCCATLLSTGYGRKIMEGSILCESIQNLIINDKDGKMVAKATVYVNKQQGYAVFNDIEMNWQYGDENNEDDFSDNKQRIKIYKAFKRGVNDFVKEYNKINERPIVQANVGWRNNKLKQTITLLEGEEAKHYYNLKAPEFFEDARDKQVLIYSKPLKRKK